MSIEHLPKEALISRLGHTLANHRVPFAGSIELCNGCNFNCPHCYLGQKRNALCPIDTERLISLFPELADAGCLALTLTGGEPLRHPHFRRIYQAAHRHGFWLNLFTNGALIDDPTADLLAQFPPRVVEITLYGATDPVHDKVTCTTGERNRVLAGVERLIQRNINVVLKSVLSTQLLGEIDQLRLLADTYGVPFQVDGGITPTLDGAPHPTKQRVSPTNVAATELHTRSRAAQLARYHHQHQNRPAGDPPCGAGYNGFHIDADGRLTPCVMLRTPAVSLHETSFLQAWEALGGPPRPHFAPDSSCADCDLAHLCNYCPGAKQCGDKAIDEKNSFYCEVAKARLTGIESVELKKTQ